MGTTAKGIPYPEGTDRVMDGDDAIKASAVKVDALLPASRTGSVTTDANGLATVTHNLGTVPTSAIFQLDATGGSLYTHWLVDTYTATTVRVRVFDSAGATAVSKVIPYRATYFLT